MIYSKIQKVKDLIKSTTIKKLGRNEHSKYDYFTPEQIDQLVHDNCKESKLFNKFDLIRTEKGLIGQIEVISLEDEEKATYQMAAEIPQITATNISQQLGGAMTYTKRYLLMNIYDITDNNLDFDTSPKTGSKAENKDSVKRETTLKEVEEKWNGKIYSDKYIYIDNIKIEPPQDQIKKLKEHKNYKEK